MKIQHASILCVFASMIILSGCNSDEERLLGNKENLPSDAGRMIATLDPVSNSVEESPMAESSISAVVGASEIPYPIYPNGSKYRVGGENGLKIVVFQTEDSFAKVDGYYKSLTGDSGMPRLVAMNDYVRYSSSTDDKDPWATYRPGIVIHQFNEDGERTAVGAKGSAQTNIIMSF
ncbi:MAG: hypothetical protein AB8B79_13520 [Granulosicoccus sp.]